MSHSRNLEPIDQETCEEVILVAKESKRCDNDKKTESCKK